MMDKGDKLSQFKQAQELFTNLPASGREQILTIMEHLFNALGLASNKEASTRRRELRIFKRRKFRG